jgi:small subunit ribosomal protein S18
VKYIDYKQQDVLRRYVTEHGRIRPRRQTGTCAKHQRGLARAVKQARHIALLPFVED